jgi:hypothetical protein
MPPAGAVSISCREAAFLQVALEAIDHGIDSGGVVGVRVRVHDRAKQLNQRRILRLDPLHHLALTGFQTHCRLLRSTPSARCKPGRETKGKA